MTQITPEVLLGERRSIKGNSLGRKLVFSVLAFIVFASFAKLSLRMPVWFFAILVPIFALPATLIGGVSSALAQGHRLTLLSEEGWLRRLLSGATVRLLVASVSSVVLGAVALVLLANAGPKEWSLSVFSIVTFGILYRYIQIRIGPQIAFPYRLSYGVRWARWGAALGVTFLNFLFERFISSAVITLDFTLPSAKSAVVQELIGVSYVINQLTNYASGKAIEAEGWWAEMAVACVAIGYFSLAWTAASIAGIFAVPAREFKRVLGPASISQQPPTLTKLTIAMTSAILTVVLLFIWLPQIALLEASLQHSNYSASYAERMSDAGEHTICEIERIGEDAFSVGTLAEVGKILTSGQARTESARNQLIAALHAGAENMERNVDPFLDGYYSLWGEYSRIFALLSGELEEEISSKLHAELVAGHPYQEFEEIFNAGLAAESEAARTLPTLVDEAMASRRIELEKLQCDSVLVVASQVDPLVTHVPAFERMKERFDDRMNYASGGSGVGFVVAALVGKKIAAKGTLKLAGKAVLKVATSKATGGGLGASGGAIAGGAVGSLIPGLGTAAGAIVGGILGAVGGGVLVDAAVLGIEEHLARERFRDEIIAAIREQRDEMIADVNKVFAPIPRRGG